MVAKNRIETGLNYIYVCNLVSLCFFLLLPFLGEKKIYIKQIVIQYFRGC